MSDPVGRYLSRYGGATNRADDDDPVERYMQRYGPGADFSNVEAGSSSTQRKAPTHPLAALGKKVTAGARGLMEGALLGGSDEAAAALSVHRDDEGFDRGPAEPGGSLSQRYQQFKQGREETRAREPGAYGTGELAGIFAPAVASSGGTSALGLMGRLMQAGKVGAALGAGSGALSTEGGFKERAKGAAIGGALGGALAPAGAAAVEGIGRGLPAVSRHLGEAADFVVRGPAYRGPAVGAIAGAVFSGGDVERRAKGAMIGAGVGAMSQGAGKAAMKARGRFVPELQKATGVPRVNVKQLVTKMRDAQKAQSAPIYEALWQQHNQPVIDQNVLQLIEKKPVLQRAFKRAQETMQEFGLDLPVITTASGSKITQRTVPTPQMLHYMKMEVDDEIAKLMKGVAKPGQSTDIASKTKTLNQFREQLERLVPGYREANAQHAAESRAQQRLVEGWNAWKKGPDEVERALASLSDPDELHYYRLGLANRLYETAGGKGAKVNLAESLFGTGAGAPGAPDKLRLLRTLFPDEASYQDFVQRVLLGKRPVGPRITNLQRMAAQLGGRVPIATSRQEQP